MTYQLNDSVAIRLENNVLHLTLNRPEKLNAFNPEMHLALRQGLNRAEQDESVRAVLLTGAGRGFCAGQDLAERNPDAGNTAPDLGATIEEYYNPLVRQIRALPKPVICAVQKCIPFSRLSINFA